MRVMKYYVMLVFGWLLLVNICLADNSTIPCPADCGNTCKYDIQGEIITAKCKDSTIQQLPNSLVTLHVYDLKDTLKMPLGKFPEFVLMGKVNLTSLKIENYQLTSLESSCFQKSPNLERLDLSRNALQQISKDSFSGLTNLSYLNLNENALQSLGDNLFRQLPSLVELYISRNKLVSIGDQDFSGLNNIAKIVLQANQISSINRLAFHNLSTVEDINLQENHLTSVDKGLFTNLPNLANLNLQQNDIRILDPEAMQGTRNLVMLKLADNMIPTLPTVLLLQICNPALIVSLSINDITELPDGAFENIVLQGLSLSNNNISLIGPDVLRDSDIAMLDLRGNALTHIPADLVDDVKTTAKIMLRDNPWSCDCDIQSVASLIGITDEKLVCHSPKNYSGFLISNVTQELNETCNWQTTDGDVEKGSHSVDVGVIVGSVVGAMALIGGITALVLKCCVLSRKVAPTDKDEEDCEGQNTKNDVVSSVNMT